MVETGRLHVGKDYVSATELIMVCLGMSTIWGSWFLFLNDQLLLLTKKKIKILLESCQSFTHDCLSISFLEWKKKKKHGRRRKMKILFDSCLLQCVLDHLNFLLECKFEASNYERVKRLKFLLTHLCPPFQHLLSERLTSLGIMGAPRVPPLGRETQSLGQQMLNATVGINGLIAPTA